MITEKEKFFEHIGHAMAEASSYIRFSSEEDDRKCGSHASITCECMFKNVSDTIEEHRKE